MSSHSESSFGAKLRKAQDIQTFVAGFTGYNPPRAQESASGFLTFLNSIVTTNGTESSQEENYHVAVSLRHDAFVVKPSSVQKLLVQVKGAVESQFGKKSVEAATVNAIIKKMRNSKLIKLPADPTHPDQAKKLSQSEHSYGSWAQYFNDIINTLSQFTGYNPTNLTIRVTALQSTATQLTTLSNTVIQKIQALKTTRVSRSSMYDDLRDRVQRIKAYVKAQYGNTSTEYNSIKGIRI
jgi:hypothetical protein